MSIRYKTLIMIGSIFIVLLVVLLINARMVMLNSFLSLKKQMRSWIPNAV